MPDNIRAPERARALQMRSAAKQRANRITHLLDRGPLYPLDRARIIAAATRAPDVDQVAPLAPLDQAGQAS